MNNEKNGITRRKFAKLCLNGMVTLTAFLNGCASIVRPNQPETCDPGQDESSEEYDYIVVGSGAGGGPLAANLARKGHRVLLVEAGGDEENENYSIPLFHPMASEDPTFRWDFFVRHFKDKKVSLKDPKFSPDQDGLFYPRCSTLGGCTAHNAMIMIYPHNEDWDYIAELTGDPSWGSESMRTYFERLENCQYAKESLIDKRSRHGFDGWLPTSLPTLDTVLSVFRDRQLRDILIGSVLTALHQHVGNPIELLKARFDPNDWRSVKARNEGLCKVPLTTFQGKRVGSREFIRKVEQNCAGKLTVKLNTLVTRIILEDSNPSGGVTARKKAVGIEYRQGKRLYRADRQTSIAVKYQQGSIRARNEVILAGGAFNTPQMLMLSGIGPKKHLNEMGISVQVDLPGVGQNLQDRYEVAVVTEMKHEFSMLKGMSFTIPQQGEPPNPLYQQWQKNEGLFTTNGAVISFMKKSSMLQPSPDLFIFGMPGYFAGYYPGYSKRIAEDQKHFTWAILKAHTKNNAGVVRLKSTDPCERPYINFNYFDDGSDIKGEDLQGLVHGIEFVRSITRSKGMLEHIAQEVVPGAEIKTPEQMAEFAKYNAWGHHASCSCKMGDEKEVMAVVDSRFRVRNVDNLRIVDASIFPRIPGFFIVSAIYMISEKAADTIHEDFTSSKSQSNEGLISRA
jgi:choline dehydrogenase